MNYPSWFVIIPTVLTLLTAILKRDVILSLLIGIISGALIKNNFNIKNSILNIISHFITESNIKSLYINEVSATHLYTFGFLIFLGTIISLITITGGIKAYSMLIEKNIKNKGNIESASLIISSFLFIDDYLNNLITGCIIRPLSDKFKIPRAKLAYLLDSLSASLCVIIPASSWTALILTELKTSGITKDITSNTIILADPFVIYLNSIFYMFYPILIIASTWFIVKKNISFGPMKQHQIIALEKNNLFGNKEPINIKLSPCKNDGTIWDFIIPILSFLSLTIIFIFYLGAWSIKNPIKSILNVILNLNPIKALFLASFFSLAISIIYFYVNKKINFYDIKLIFKEGFNLMKNSLTVLMLAWTFGAILEQDLHTGQYLANILIFNMPNFLLPIIIFIISIIISATIGSAWATIAIIMPIAIPLASFNNIQLIYPIIGAIISGAISGGHISPISDSTIMAATSAGAYHIDHVITQIFYVLPSIISTIFAFIFTGILIYHNINNILVISITLSISIIINFILLYLANKINKN